MGDSRAFPEAAGPRSHEGARLPQLERVSEVASGQRGIAKIIKSNAPERHMGPDVGVTRRKRISKRVSRRLRVTFLPELYPLFIILPGFFDLSRVNELKLAIGQLQ